MKQIYFILLLITLSITAKCQHQPENPGFEFWEDVELNTDEPVDWSSIKTSDNDFLSGLAPYVWDQSTDAHSGSYSVKLISQSILTTVAAGIITNGMVHADFNPTNGYVFTNTSDARWNTPFTLTPDSIAVWVKFIPQGSDVGQLKAVLHTGTAKIPDAAMTNYIALAQIDIPDPTNTWTRFSAPFNYFNNTVPEYILFVLSGGGASATDNTTIYFDDLELIYNPVLLDLTVFLQGAYYNNMQMYTSLNPTYIPNEQPFDVAPWNYNGTESIVALSSPDIVDWVLVEARDAASAATASSATTVGRQAAFLLKGGSIVGLDGVSRISFDISINQHLFAVVHHRNHLSIMSASALTKSGGEYAWDFSTSSAQTYGGSAGCVQLNTFGTAVWGMIGGDANADGQINMDDRIQSWYPNAGTNGYAGSDMNLDGQTGNLDKNKVWLNNLNKQSQVPQ